MKLKAYLTLSVFVLSFLPFLAYPQETLTITTYYPSPYGSYRELRATRMAIGDNYINGGSYSWDSGTINANADLVVEGNVGIGTASPGAKLELSADNQEYMFGLKDTHSGGIQWAFLNGATYTYGGGQQGKLIIGTGQPGLTFQDRLTIQPNGNVGIGTPSPSYQLQLSTDSAAKPSTTTWTVTSDSRVKKDIRPYTNGLKIIKGINPVWFKYNGKGGFPDDNQNHIGVIAQEIAKVAPYTVNTYKAKLNPSDKEETELLNFNPHALVFDLINSVKELDNNITQLAQENQELKKDNKELTSEIGNIRTRLSRLEAKEK